ncbi:MAG TPA: DUF3011 domain-containing protein [Rudaea sp.]|nr:DUF3011 domain-containing protein [Rudaea sp.]
MSPLRAAFILVLAGGAPSALAEQITCESHQEGTEACATIQPGGSVRLVQQISNAPCVQGRSWGMLTSPNHDSIWVSGGCRAVFDVQPPYVSANRVQPDAGPDTRQYASASHSPQWQRGFADGERGVFDIRADSRAYRDGYRAGEDAVQNANRFSEARNPSGEYPYRADQPRSDERASGTRYASADSSPRRIARRACIEQAASGQPFDSDQIRTDGVRWVGRGMLSVDVDTPDGPLTCTVDRDGNVQSLQGR